MIEAVSNPGNAEAVEGVLRQELAHGDAVLGTVAPILRYLLTSDDNSVFSDEILARVRGMVASLGAELLDALVLAAGETERRDHSAEERDAIAATFVASPAMLGHLHALALEWQLTERLHARLGVDPVLSPLLQSLVAASEAETAALGMKLVAAQARFSQAQRRMSHSLEELPGDLFHAALLSMRAHAGADAAADQLAATAERTLRRRYDEAHSRLGLISRLVSGLGGKVDSALSVAHAGPAMFLTALSLASGQDRDLAVLSTAESQLARLALSMRAAGMKPAMIEEQFLALHPDVSLPEHFGQLGADGAAAILSLSSFPYRG